MYKSLTYEFWYTMTIVDGVDTGACMSKFLRVRKQMAVIFRTFGAVYDERKRWYIKLLDDFKQTMSIKPSSKFAH